MLTHYPSSIIHHGFMPCPIYGHTYPSSCSPPLPPSPLCSVQAWYSSSRKFELPSGTSRPYTFISGTLRSDTETQCLRRVSLRLQFCLAMQQLAVRHANSGSPPMEGGGLALARRASATCRQYRGRGELSRTHRHDVIHGRQRTSSGYGMSRCGVTTYRGCASRIRNISMGLRSSSTWSDSVKYTWSKSYRPLRSLSLTCCTVETGRAAGLGRGGARTTSKKGRPEWNLQEE
jgi:hypothetical protein